MPPRKKKAAVASTSKSKSIAQEILIVSDDESASQSSSVQILPPSVSPSTRLRSSAARQRALELVTVVDQSDPRSLLASQRERFTGKGTCRCGNDLIPPSSTSDNPVRFLHLFITQFQQRDWKLKIRLSDNRARSNYRPRPSRATLSPWV